MSRARGLLVSRVLLTVLGLASLCLTTTVNRIAGRILIHSASRFDWIADATVPSLLVCLCLYLAVRPARPFAAPPAGVDWPPIFRLSAVYLAIWLGASAAVAYFRGGWFAYTHGAAEIAAFVIVAPFAEEMFFRGTLFELAERSFPGDSRRAIWFTTVFFSLQHFQLHGYRADAAALTQVAFTFPMGLVFATIRSRSKSLWPALLVHVLTNLPGAFGR